MLSLVPSFITSTTSITSTTATTSITSLGLGLTGVNEDRVKKY